MASHTRTSSPTGKASFEVLVWVTATNSLSTRDTVQSDRNFPTFSAVCPEGGNSVTTRNVDTFLIRTTGRFPISLGKRYVLCGICLSSTACTDTWLVQNVMFCVSHQTVAHFEVFRWGSSRGAWVYNTGCEQPLLTYTAPNVTFKDET